MRKSDAFLSFIAICLMTLLAILIQSERTVRVASSALAEQSGLVKRLGLTDLCLFTDARYMRHPAMADHSSAFQEHPASMEHFPSGSFSTPPRHIGTR